MDTTDKASDLTARFIESLCKGERVETNQLFTSLGSFQEKEEMLVEVLEIIGNGWVNDEYSLAQIYIAGVISEELILNSMASERKTTHSKKIGIAVLIDHHNLGKKIVMLAAMVAGYEILDLGAGLSVDELVSKTKELDLDVLMISTLMLPSTLKTASVIEKLKADNEHIKVIVGGAPFRLDESLWIKVKADGFGRTATDALSILKEVI